jgi:hypothetical protein
MVSFLGTDIVIPVAVLQAVQPYSHECSCSTPVLSYSSTLISTPSDCDLLAPFPSILIEVSHLPTIPEGFEPEIQVTPIIKTPPVIASKFTPPPTSHYVPWFPASTSPGLILSLITFTTNLKTKFVVPQTILSFRPPPEPPPTLLPHSCIHAKQGGTDRPSKGI